MLLLLAMTCGCIVNKDISRNPSRYTDYSVGSIYRLKRDVLVTPNTDALMPTDRIRFGTPVKIGTLLKVDRVVYRRNPTIGRITKIYANLIGEAYPHQVALTWISKPDLHTGITLIDPEFLELVVDD